MVAGAIAVYALKNLELPEEERPFDIIGMYSSNKAKRDTFIQGGGALYSIRIGKTYIPFGETPFVLLLGGVASSVDRVRDGKDPSPDTAMQMSMSGLTMMGHMLGGLGSISMFRGVTDLASGIGDAIKGQQGADVKVARTLVSAVKGFIPASSVLRTIARYTDNPVDARRDFASALVEGLPVLQSAFGKPALNVFGEPLKNNKTMQLHRVFSTKADDLDIRWLVDNGYHVPGIANMRFSKEVQEYVNAGKSAAADKLDYELRYKVFRSASPDLRNLISQARGQFGQSAHNPEVQKALSAAFNRILAEHSARIVR
jgi:hypothetical protein